ncbi:hypothetical protein ACLOJK_030604 [Asimina triloba]
MGHCGGIDSKGGREGGQGGVCGASLEASCGRGLDAAQAQVVEKQVTKLNSEFRRALKAKEEEGLFGSGALMLVLTNVLEAVLGEYHSSVTFKSMETSNCSFYIRDGY